ncbi:S1 RNA-binding domain-containing protein [Nocardia beijingensis]
MSGPWGPELENRLEEPLPGCDDPRILLVASAICTPPLVPYSLLRAARRLVLPAGTLSVESQLCASPVVESNSVDGFTFEPEFANALRSRLRMLLVADGLAANLGALRTIIERTTVDLSPLLRLEEQICWSYATASDFRPLRDDVLSSVVRTIARENRMRMLQWVSGAFARLPSEVVEGGPAWMLTQLCRAQGLPARHIGWPDDGADEELLAEAMALLPERPLGVARDGEFLEVGSVTQRRRNAILVPRVDPMILTISSGESEPTTTRVRVRIPGPAVRVRTGRDAVSIRDMRRRTYRLDEFSPEESAPETVAADRMIQAIDRHWRRRETLPCTAARALPGGRGLIVTFRDFAGLSALLPASRAGVSSFKVLQQLVGSEMTVRVINCNVREQRVVVERVLPAWSIGSLTVGARFTGEVVQRVAFGLFVSFADAAGIPPENRTGQEVGLVHVTEMSWNSKKPAPDEFPAQVGDMLEVVVLEIDFDRQRVSLSHKATIRSPWQTVSELYQRGSRVHGRVVKVVPFGWFIDFGFAQEALLHSSEASAGTVLTNGQEIDCWILSIDPEARRISLTMFPPADLSE